MILCEGHCVSRKWSAMKLYKLFMIGSFASFLPPPPPPSLLSSIPSLKVPPVCRCYCTFGERRAFPVGDLTDSTLLSSHCVFRRGRLSRISILLQQVKETCILIKYLVTRNKVEFSINFQQSYHASI